MPYSAAGIFQPPYAAAGVRTQVSQSSCTDPGSYEGRWVTLKHTNAAEIVDRKVVSQLNVNLSAADIDRILDEADMDMDGKVSFEEFVLLMTPK